MARLGKKEKDAELIRLWLLRPEDQRTDHDVLGYYGWLEQNKPELLTRGHGDPYQHLGPALRPYIRESR
ncbi:MAG: hypothetical protein WCB12_04075 [Bryobacteraceae bacterium]